MNRFYTILLIASASTALGACGQTEDQAQIAALQRQNEQLAAQNKAFMSAEECSKTGVDKEACMKGYQAALADYNANAPRYSSLDQCIANFGADKCTAHHSSGGDWFGPMFMGYMLGSMSSGGNYGYYSQPVYRTRTGGYYNPHNPKVRASSLAKAYTPPARSTFRPITTKLTRQASLSSTNLAVRPRTTPTPVFNAAKVTGSVNRGGLGTTGATKGAVTSSTRSGWLSSRSTSTPRTSSFGSSRSSSFGSSRSSFGSRSGGFSGGRSSGS